MRKRLANPNVGLFYKHLARREMQKSQGHENQRSCEVVQIKED